MCERYCNRRPTTSLPSPRKLDAAVPRDLETVTLKCLEKDPGRRYQAAIEVAAELRRFLKGEPVLARPVSQSERFWRWCKRQPVVASLAATVAALLLVVTGVSTAGYVVTHGALERERMALRKEEAAKKDADHEAANAKSSKDIAVREAATANKSTEFMTNLFESSDTIGLGGIGFQDPSEGPKKLTVLVVLQRGAKRITETLNDEPLVQARLMATIGNVDRSLGYYDDAEPLLRKALKIGESRLEPDAAELSESLLNLGWLLQDEGKYAEAEPLFRRAGQIRTKVFGPESLPVADVNFHLAWLLADLDRSAEAESLFRAVLRVRRQQPSRQLDRRIRSARASISTSSLFTEHNNVEAMQTAASLFAAGDLAKVLLTYEIGVAARCQEFRLGGSREDNPCSARPRSRWGRTTCWSQPCWRIWPGC